jgi:hypothetical protein
MVPGAETPVLPRRETRRHACPGRTEPSDATMLGQVRAEKFDRLGDVGGGVGSHLPLDR